MRTGDVLQGRQLLLDLLLHLKVQQGVKRTVMLLMRQLCPLCRRGWVCMEGQHVRLLPSMPIANVAAPFHGLSDAVHGGFGHNI